MINFLHDKIRRECTCKNGRVDCNCRSVKLPLMTWRDERDFLANSCGEPRTAIGFAFFFLAATVLKTGILVLAHSYYPGAEQREVHDFGTETYEKTMIIYASSHGHCTVGHFETVGRCHGDGRLYQTIFPKDDPVIIGIKTWGSHWINEKTVEEYRIICYVHYPASEVIDHLLASTVMVDSTIASSNEEDTPVAHLVAHLVERNQRRNQRKRTSTTRAIESKEQESTPTARVAARSLSSVIDKAATAVATRQHDSTATTAVPTTQVLNPLTRAASTPVSKSQSVRPSKKGRCKHFHTRITPVVLAPPSNRLAIYSDKLLTNVRQWIRESAPPTRFAPKVHNSVAGQWVQQCRSVLLDIVAALRRQDTRAAISHLCVLWMLPREVFSVPAGGSQKRKQRRIAEIREKLGRRDLIQQLSNKIATGDDSETKREEPNDEQVVEQLSQYTRTVTGPIATHASADSSHNSIGDVEGQQIVSDRRVAQRTQQLFEHGHNHRAMECVKSELELADLDVREERASMRQLHPSAADGRMKTPT